MPHTLYFRYLLVSEKHRAKLDRTAAKLGLEVLPGRWATCVLFNAKFLVDYRTVFIWRYFIIVLSAVPWRETAFPL